MGVGRLLRGGRVVAAVGVALLAGIATATGASAASFTFATTALPPSPFHMAIGDELTLNDSPPPPPPPGWEYTTPAQAIVPTTPDATILAPISSSVDSAGIAHATFKALRAGTVSLAVGPHEPCLQTIPTTSTTTVTTTISSSSVTTTQTSTSTRTAPGAGVCAATTPFGWQVIVDAGVQGASTTVPAVGGGGSQALGIWLLAAGAVLAAAATGWRTTRRR